MIKGNPGLANAGPMVHLGVTVVSGLRGSPLTLEFVMMIPLTSRLFQVLKFIKTKINK